MAELVHFGSTDPVTTEQYNETQDADMVNHPPHYTQYEGFEVIDIVEQLDYNRGTAVKYIMRSGSKWNTIQDIDKAIWYLNRYKERLTKKK